MPAERIPLVQEKTAAIKRDNSTAPAYADTSFIDQQARPLIGVDDFFADPQYAGVTGEGYSIVILDTSIERVHPYFGPDGDEDGVSDRIVFSYDFFHDDNDVSGGPNSHGMLVASTAAGFASFAGLLPPQKGMAPGANIIYLQVFPDGSLSSNFGVFEEGLIWALQNADEYNIVSVNMSWSDNGNHQQATTLPAAGISDELQALSAMGVIPVSTAGNKFFSHNSVPGVAYPGADPNALAIGATFDADIGAKVWTDGARDFTSGTDRVTAYSQRHGALMDVFAPGSQILGAGQGGFLAAGNGTSFAAPHITGMIALAQQLSVEQTGSRIPLADMASLLISTGDLIFDGEDENDNVTNTNAYYPRANMLALANQIIVPKVTGVTIGSSASTHADYVMPVGSGEQLRTVPVGQANQIMVAFSKQVNVQKTDLSLFGAASSTSYDVAGSTFSYDTFAHVATWTFPTPFPRDQMELTLSSAITDTAVAPNALDGEWLNPDSLGQATSNAYPSGDGFAGGAFVFRFTILPGDSDRDNDVDFDDVNNVRNHFGLSPALWTDGDTSGNNVVDIDDLNNARNNFGANYATWPGAAAAQSLSAPVAVSIGEDALRAALVDYYLSRRAVPESPGLYDDLFGWRFLGNDQWWNELLTMNGKSA